MTERDESGQFTSAEPLYGRAALETDAGYTPMPEDPKDEPYSVLDAAEELSQVSSTAESDIQTYSAISDLDAKVSMTVEQGAKALTEMNEADAEQAKLDKDEKIRAEVDELRGVKPDAKAEEAKTEAPAEPLRDGELDPDIERALSNPKIRGAIEQQINGAETARQQYVASIDAATTIAQAAFISQFPEFTNIPADQRGQVLAVMQQQDPQRYERIALAVQNSSRLFEEQKNQHQWQEQRKAVEFQHFSKQEDARFAEMMKGERNMPAIEAEIPAMLKSLGVDPLEYLRAGNESKFLRSAASQAILAKAAKYDLLMKAPKAVASKPLPTVQKPGVARPATNAASAREQELTQTFNRTGSLKAAQELYALQSNRRRAS